MFDVQNEAWNTISPLIYQKFQQMLETEPSHIQNVDKQRMQRFLIMKKCFESMIAASKTTFHYVFFKYYLGLLLEKCPQTFEKTYISLTKNQRLENIISHYVDADTFINNTKACAESKAIESIYAVIPLHITHLLNQWDLSNPYFMTIAKPNDNALEYAMILKNKVIAILKRSEPKEKMKKSENTCAQVTNYLRTFFWKGVIQAASYQEGSLPEIFRRYQ